MKQEGTPDIENLESKGAYKPPVEEIKGDDEPYITEDPRTGSIRRFKNKGEYMQDMRDNDPHNQ